MLEAAQSQEPTTPAPEAAPAPAEAAPAQQEAEPVLSDFAQGVLKDITDPAERAIMAKYLPSWDAGVTRRFQQVQSTYAPIQPLLEDGLTVDDLEVASKLYLMLDQDPQGVIDMLTQSLGGAGGSGPGQQQQTPPLGSDLVDQPTVQLPPEMQQQFQQIQQFMEHQALQAQQQELLLTAQQEDEALDQYLGLLRQEKGVDFDEDFVLAKMAAGVDGAEAVDAYIKLTGGVQQQATPAPAAPPVLSGGPASVGTAPVTAASDAERKALVTQMLAQAQATQT